MKKFWSVATLICIIMTSISVPLYAEESVSAATAPEIIAPAAVLIDAKSGIVLYDKQMHTQQYPASITKIMTALLTLEYAEDIPNKTLEEALQTERIAFSHEAVYGLPPGTSHIAMNEDETLTLNDALYGLLLASANDVSNALAEHIGGSNAGFAQMMNARAAELGATDSHFVNPHGLHDPQHYASPYDMALMMKEAIQIPKFVEIISTLHYDIPPTEKQPLPRPLDNSHKMIKPGNPYYNPNVVGGKTGYTSEAKHTLVTYAKKDGMELIAVVMNDEKYPAFTDTQALLDYGFTQFAQTQIFDDATYTGHTTVLAQDGGTLGLYAVEDVSLLLPLCVVGNITMVEVFPQPLQAPIAQGATVGTLHLQYEGKDLAQVDLFAAESIALTTPAPTQTVTVVEPVIETKSPTVPKDSESVFLFCAVALVLFGFVAVFIVYKIKVKRVRNQRRQTQKQYRYKNFFKS